MYLLVTSCVMRGTSHSIVDQTTSGVRWMPDSCSKLFEVGLFIAHILSILVLWVIVIIVSTLTLFLLFIEVHHLVGAILSNYVFKYSAPGLLLRTIHISIFLHLLLEPLLIVVCLLLLAHLLFVNLRVVDEAHWARSILSCWSLFKITTNHLLFNKFESIG